GIDLLLAMNAQGLGGRVAARGYGLGFGSRGGSGERGAEAVSAWEGGVMSDFDVVFEERCTELVYCLHLVVDVCELCDTFVGQKESLFLAFGKEAAYRHLRVAPP